MAGHSQTRYTKCLAARSKFDCIKVPTSDRRAYEGIDFRPDFGRDDFLAVPFFVASCEAALGCVSRASHSRSLTSTNSLAIARNRLYSAICERVVSTA
jgi:hypothetical protein